MLVAEKLYRFVKPEPSEVTANTVPWPKLPPRTVVPYSVLPNQIKPATGLAPSLMAVKVCRTAKPFPSVLTANAVPQLDIPPFCVVPYIVLPKSINPATGLAPSLLV